ncbi:MAG: hypothetical protein LH474_08545 [Chamaesiphon sp.]|nr:hypothetical protein [Chamaesiphon sp.]
MASSTPLHGTELIDCAQASAKQGIEVTAQQCGYSNDIDTFQHELTVALVDMGIKNKHFDDLLKKVVLAPNLGIEIAPDTATEL